MNRDRIVKRACRNSPCANCGGIPPFETGPRCQPHRIKPGSKGGRYTWRNTMPLCPTCHGQEPGHSPLTEHAYASGMTGWSKARRRKAAALMKLVRAALTPDQLRQARRRAIRKISLAWKRDPAKMRRVWRTAGLRRWAKRTPAQRAAIAQKMATTRRRNAVLKLKEAA